MSVVKLPGVLRKHDKLFTENLGSARGQRVYNERLISIDDLEYRSWNPYRSKLAAALLKGMPLHSLSEDTHVLYLGAATGTTVSHLSDIVKHGCVYAVEHSPIAMKKLLLVCEKRSNVIPLLFDANHPERYQIFVSTSVDFLYQDISQRNQAQIFLSNMNRFLKPGGHGVLMVKARSIDVSLKPKEAYKLVEEELLADNVQITKILDLLPYEKDHAAFLVSSPE